MKERALVAHAAGGAAPGLALASGVARARDGALRVVYRLSGDLARVALPTPERAERADGLWAHTCFELFAAAERGQAYVELNFSPSTRWAAYAFSDYRQGMQPLELGEPPEVHVERASNALTVTTDVNFGGGLDAGVPWRIGLSAVIEDAAGVLSYWALRHSGPKPDFHAAADWLWRI